jgi:N-acetylmuramic acid 6-phosphate etherase
MLDTERPHPKTTPLSQLANEDLPAAIELLKEVDRDALAILGDKMESLIPLAEAIAATLYAGKKIFLCGCGATGRLSISLEIFARDGLLEGATPGNVIGFMAGGDAALIRSIERFEDRPDYGERQMRDLGFF